MTWLAHEAPLHVGVFDQPSLGLDEAQRAFAELVESLLPRAAENGVLASRVGVTPSLLPYLASPSDLDAGHSVLDWIVLLDCTPHQSDARRLIASAYRRLREGGTLVLATPVSAALEPELGRWRSSSTISRDTLADSTGRQETVHSSSGLSAVALGPPHSELVRTLLEQGFLIRRELGIGRRVQPSYRHLRERVAMLGDAPDAAGSKLAPPEDIRELRRQFATLDERSVDYRVIHARKDSYRIRLFCEGDEHSILDLFARCFHQQCSLEQWRWKYQHNPYGRVLISLGCDSSGELVSHYAAYPVRLYRPPHTTSRSETSLQEAEQLAYQIGDTMTAASVRHVGRGPTSLLSRTARHFYATFCEGRVAFNYGFNTANIQKFSMRFLGVEKVEEVPYRQLDLSTEWPKWSAREPSESRYRVERVTALDARFDRLYLETRDLYGMMVERDTRYLQWRYLDRPDTDYQLVAASSNGRLVGWSVFLWREDRLVWGDALFHPQHVAATAAVLRSAARHSLPAGGCSAIVCWFPERPDWWHRCLVDLGFEMRPEPQNLDMGTKPFLEPEACTKLREDFYYAYADSDLF